MFFPVFRNKVITCMWTYCS